MPITHQTEGHANHPAWIRCELDWILASQPLVSLGSGPLQAPLAALGAKRTADASLASRERLENEFGLKSRNIVQ